MKIQEARRFLHSHWVMFVTGFYAAAICVSPMLATKVVSFWGFTFAAGILLSFFGAQLVDTVNELFDKKDCKRIVYTALSVKLFVYLIAIPAVIRMPAANPEAAAATDAFLSFSFRVFVATMVANFVQNIVVDIPFFHFLKKYPIGFAGRSTLSNLLAWTSSGLVFVFVGFWGTPMFTWAFVFGQMIVRYPLKVVYVALTTPLVRFLRVE